MVWKSPDGPPKSLHPCYVFDVCVILIEMYVFVFDVCVTKRVFTYRSSGSVFVCFVVELGHEKWTHTHKITYPKKYVTFVVATDALIVEKSRIDL